MIFHPDNINRINVPQMFSSSMCYYSRFKKRIWPNRKKYVTDWETALHYIHSEQGKEFKHPSDLDSNCSHVFHRNANIEDSNVLSTFNYLEKNGLVEKNGRFKCGLVCYTISKEGFDLAVDRQTKRTNLLKDSITLYATISSLAFLILSVFSTVNTGRAFFAILIIYFIILLTLGVNVMRITEILADPCSS